MRGCNKLQGVASGRCEAGATLGVETCEGDAKLVHPSRAAGLPTRPRIQPTLAHEAEVLPEIGDGAPTQRLG